MRNEDYFWTRSPQARYMNNGHTSKIGDKSALLGCKHVVREAKIETVCEKLSKKMVIKWL